jgi:NAD(P)-dependent dehydrogenase (short-subunit alcohol dehydrogenase family)
MTTLSILTGASRGLGRAMAEQLLVRGDRLLTLSRHPDHALEAIAHARGAVLEQWAADLAAPSHANGLFGAWLSEFASRHAADRPARLNLIHNAALITPPGPIDDLPPDELADALRVGLEAPMLFTATFLRLTSGWGGDRRVLFISSGLGRRAMAGSAPYCAIKAGLDNFARALALDEAARGAGGARVASLAPGVIDTDMQRQLRGAGDGFIERERFAALHREGQLDTPEACARKVLARLNRADFGSVVLDDVRNP